MRGVFILTRYKEVVNYSSALKTKNLLLNLSLLPTEDEAMDKTDVEGDVSSYKVDLPFRICISVLIKNNNRFPRTMGL